MAVRLPGRTGHAELAGAVGGDVRVVVARDHLRRLAGSGRCGELGVQHAAIAGERAATAVERDDDLVGDRVAEREQVGCTATLPSVRETVRAGRTWCATYVVASTKARPGYEVAACSSITW